MAEVIALVLLLLAPPLPAAGLKAEMAGQWQEAVVLYEQELERDPERADLWLRIADIEARLGRTDEVARALRQAAAVAPGDASIWFRLSQANGMLGRPEPAWQAVHQASVLDPANLEYASARAQLATWTGRYREAQQAYHQLLRAGRAAQQTRLALARVSSWLGDLDAAAREYAAYLRQTPQDATALREKARVEAWRGNYAVALETLERYRTAPGADRAVYAQEKARALAWTGRGRAALALLEGPAEPSQQFERSLSRAIAFSQAGRPGEALAGLDAVELLQPARPETSDLRRYLRTPHRSSLVPSLRAYRDTTDLTLLHASLEAGYSSSVRTRLTAGAGSDELHAERGSGLERTDGVEDARQWEGWMGTSLRLSPAVVVDGRVGVARLAGGREVFTYRVGADFTPADGLSLRAEHGRSPWLVSPRAMGLGIERTTSQARAVWRPDARHVVDMSGAFEALSDDNERWEAVAWPRRAVVRRQRFNLDVGVKAWWFGFDRDLDHGYYDPSEYQRYTATALGHWKLSKDDGLSVVVAAGAFRDDRRGRFRASWDAVAEATFGVYGDWTLQLQAAATENAGLGTGAFRGYGGIVAVTRRF